MRSEASARKIPVSRARPSSRHAVAAARIPGTFSAAIDGQPPGAAHGLDVDEGDNGTLVGARCIS
jgi:hypothetical protein